MIIHKIKQVKELPLVSIKCVRYLCNKAVDPKLEKTTHEDSKVTCKNCLRIMKKEKNRGDGSQIKDENGFIYDLD